MGSLTSRPKVPKQQAQPQVVYVAQSAPTPAPSTTASQSPAPAAPSEPEKTAEEVQSEARQENLLSRTRGRFGTVQTSFRGLLSLTDGGAARKTLLGE